jgi:transitional endoplasmic reticulum ATPase
VRLQVAATKQEDMGKGVVRLSRRAFEELGVQEGDIVEIRGKRTTAAMALSPYSEDEGVEIIRLDGLLRANADVGMGDHVEVERADVKPARRVTIAPAQQNVRLSGSPELLRRTLFRRPVIAGDVISTAVYQRTNAEGNQARYPEDVFRTFIQQPAFALQEIRLMVVSTVPRGVVQVAADTEIELLPEYTEPEEARRTDVTYDDIGGLGDSINEVREMIELPLKHPELFHRLGIDPPKGVLLHGPPGTGKTLLARAVANEADAEFFSIAGPEIMGRHYGESEERLRQVFQEAQEKSPSIVFIDEIDSIAPKRSEVTGELERRVVAQLLTLMDGLESRQNVVVIGATNRVNAIDEALRRPGRFDREIVIGVPDLQGRREVLSIHTRGMPLAEDVNIEEIARVTYGFVGADMSALTREAAMEALRRHLPRIDLDGGEIPAEILEDLRVFRSDFFGALKRVQPSAMREIMIQVPDVNWADVGGLEDAKRRCSEGSSCRSSGPKRFAGSASAQQTAFSSTARRAPARRCWRRRWRVKQKRTSSPPNRPTCSRSGTASRSSRWRDSSHARQVAPTVIFIDEIDSLAPQRGGTIGEPAVTERVVNTLLAEMDGLEELQGVVVIGATNRPTLLDPALLRPGRFDELVYVAVPDPEARLQILKIHTDRDAARRRRGAPELADRTRGYTGADLEDLVRRAGLQALRDDLEARWCR